MNEILKILSNYRKKRAFRFLLKRFNELLFIFVTVFIITAIFENVFYIKSVTPGTVEKVGIETGGVLYQVEDNLIFDNDSTRLN